MGGEVGGVRRGPVPGTGLRRPQGLRREVQGGLQEWPPERLRGWCRPNSLDHIEGHVADCARLCSGISAHRRAEPLAGVRGRGRTGIGQPAVPLLLRRK